MSLSKANQLRLKRLMRGSDEESSSDDETSNSKPDSPEPGPSKRIKLDNFQERMEVYKDGNLSFIVQQKTHKKNNKFALDDHIYQLTIENNKKHSVSPLLHSLLYGLDVAIKEILKLLKQHYDLTQHHMVYLTILERNITGSIRSGGFDLNTPDNQIVNTILGYFESFLQSSSHLNLKLNDSFSFNFKVMQPKHVQALKDQNKLVHFYGRGGKLFQPNVRKYDFLIDSPSGFLGQENEFKDECLLVSCIIAYAIHYIESGNQEKLSYYQSMLAPTSLEGGRNILSELTNIKTNCTLTNGPYEADYILKKIEEYFKCQICIFEFRENLQIAHFSSFVANEKAPVLYIYAEKNSVKLSHTFAITNLTKFFNKFSAFVCIYCKTTYRNSKGHHKCSKAESFCYCCWRRKATKDTFINNLNRPFVCVPKEGESQLCSICNRTSFSEECKTRHKFHCKRSFKCEECKRLIPISSQNFETLKKTHNCKMQKCKICYAQIEDLQSHICKVKNMKWQKFWPKMCLVLIQDNKISTYREIDEHGKFYSSVKEKEIIINYLPSSIQDRTLQSSSVVTKYGQEMEGKSFQNCFHDNKNNIESFLFSCLTLESYKNSVILVKSEEIYNLDIIMRTCINLCLKPKVSRKDARVYMIFFQSQNIKFIDPDMYFATPNSGNVLDNILQLSTDFLKEMFNFQLSIRSEHQVIPKGVMPLLHPFGQPFCSASSFTLASFKLFCMKSNIHVMKKEETGIHSTSSRPELKYVQYLEYKNPGKKYHHAMSSFGQKMFKSCIPDVFDENDLFCAFFMGCQIHSCPNPKCPIRKGRTTNFRNRPDTEVRAEDEAKMDRLREECPGINIHTIWECQFNEICKEDTDFSKHFVERTRKRLCPRDA